MEYDSLGGMLDAVTLCRSKREQLDGFQISVLKSVTDCCTNQAKTETIFLQICAQICIRGQILAPRL